MIASWMLYALVVGLLVTLAGLAGERVLVLLRKPVRWVWTVGLAFSLLIPAVGHFLPRDPSVFLPVERARTITRDLIAAPMMRLGQDTASSWWPGALVDQVLLAGWIVGSLGLAHLVLYSLAVLHGRRREWKRQRVDETEALISPDFGPAVVGWRRLEIVLPAWTLALPADARALVVRHELEHLERRDPRLLLLSFVLVILMPWNPLLWLQFRRLRRAIELDCDARVIRSGVSPAHYGRVLLDAASRCGRPRIPALAAFAERAKDLEARIEALTRRVPRRRRLQLGAAGAVAVMLGGAACVMPDPLSPEVQRAIEALPDEPVKAHISEWLEHIRGKGYRGVVFMVFDSEGTLLRVENQAPGAKGEAETSKFLQSIRSSEIGSIEVIKGKAIREPGVEGVIVISLKNDSAILRSENTELTEKMKARSRPLILLRPRG
jgi:bla regulator protein BlaR1